MSDIITLTVKILDKEYCISCPEADKDALIQSVQLLQIKMKDIRDTGKLVGNERISVMAAINIAHEFIQLKTTQTERVLYLANRIRTLQDKVEDIIQQKTSEIM